MVRYVTWAVVALLGISAGGASVLTYGASANAGASAVRRTASPPAPAHPPSRLEMAPGPVASPPTTVPVTTVTPPAPPAAPAPTIPPSAASLPTTPLSTIGPAAVARVPAPVPVPATVLGYPSIPDPRTSRPFSADFQHACLGGAGGCDAAALADIDAARGGEGLGPLALPANYGQLGLAGQVIAVANAERTSRNLPAFAESSSYDAAAYAGAVHNTDPTGPRDRQWVSNVSSGLPSALAADYVWMYDDGPASPNVDCPAPSSAGCWGHRQNILVAFAGTAGAGAYTSGNMLMLAQLFVRG